MRRALGIMTLGMMAFWGCHSAVVAERRPESKFECCKTMGPVVEWLRGIGLYRYGMTPDEVKELLKKARYCDHTFEVREVLWPLSKQQPPARGPYFGIFEKGVAGDPISILIVDRGVFAFGADRFDVAKGSFQWFHLPGNPIMLDQLKAAQNAREADFARVYWGKERALREYLGQPHSVANLGDFVTALFADQPATRWAYREADSAQYRFRDDSLLKDGINCAFERGLDWDSIYFVEWQENPYGQQLDPRYSTLANIYVKNGQITGVLWYEWNCDGATSWSFMRVNAEWYPHRTLYFWRFDS